MNKQDRHKNVTSKGIRLDELRPSPPPSVPDDYFGALEARLLRIPLDRPVKRTIRLKPWIISLSAAAAVALLAVAFLIPSSREAAPGQDADAAYAYIQTEASALDAGWYDALAEAAAESIVTDTVSGSGEVWAEDVQLLENMEDEDIIAYLEEHTALNDIIINL